MNNKTSLFLKYFKFSFILTDFVNADYWFLVLILLLWLERIDYLIKAVVRFWKDQMCICVFVKNENNGISNNFGQT